jgi:hypothetical protein
MREHATHIYIPASDIGTTSNHILFFAVQVHALELGKDASALEESILKGQKCTDPVQMRLMLVESYTCVRDKSVMSLDKLDKSGYTCCFPIEIPTRWFQRHDMLASIHSMQIAAFCL